MDHRDSAQRMTDEPPEALRRLEQRLSQASAAAERLIDEAARSSRAGKPPPAGWQAPTADEAPSSSRPASELELLIVAIQGLRELVPPEVVERLAAALRELLRALRTLIDYYLERLDRPHTDTPEVRDIPIE